MTKEALQGEFTPGQKGKKLYVHDWKSRIVRWAY